MELFYGFGIVCIKFIQSRFEDFDSLMNTLNNVFNPNYLMEFIFPIISAYDSVFGAQLLLSIAFGGWFNTMLKWIFIEDRPFWWVRETTYYGNRERPLIKQNIHTCETGPGSPSGHCAAAGTIFMLAEMWLSHVSHDMKMSRLTALHKNMPLRSMYFIIISLVSIARMYAGAHFPHQCLLGALIGSVMSPALCVFVVDPYLLRNAWNPQESRRAITWHIAIACCAIAFSVFMGLVYMLLGVDLHWSTRLAFRWCQSAEFISVKSSPIFAVIQSTGSLLGWAIAVTPAVAKYRHTTRRNSFVAILASSLAVYCFKQAQEYIPNRRIPFYAAHFALNLVRPYVFLRLVPMAAMATCMDVPEKQPKRARAAPAPPPAAGGVKTE